jgi:hypothetical protein
MNPFQSDPLDRQRAIALIETLSPEQMTQALELLQKLVGSKNLETEWIEIINRRLSSEDQARLNLLRDWLYEESITEEEHQELLEWVDRIDRLDAERTSAMIQLAEYRKVDFDAIVREFPAKPLP